MITVSVTKTSPNSLRVEVVDVMAHRALTLGLTPDR